MTLPGRAERAGEVVGLRPLLAYAGSRLLTIWQRRGEHLRLSAAATRAYTLRVGNAPAVDGNIEVRPLRTYEASGGIKALICAATPVRYFPKVTGAGEVVVPTRERADCERAAE